MSVLFLRLDGFIAIWFSGTGKGQSKKGWCYPVSQEHVFGHQAVLWLKAGE